VSQLVREFLGSLHWGYRMYNYWSGGWYTGRLPLLMEDALRLIEDGEVIGVWQCYGLSIDDYCQYRDVLVLEADVGGCSTLDCVLDWLFRNISLIKPILPYASFLWYNGHKSLYFLIYLKPHAPADYGLRPDWVNYLKYLGLDLSEAQVKHAVRVIGTRHPGTNNPGRLIDSSTLNLTHHITVNPINYRVFLTPQVKPKPKPISVEGGFNWVEALRSLFQGKPIRDCRKRILHYITSNCAGDGLSLEDCLRIIRGLGIDLNEPYLNLAGRLYNHYLGLGVRLSFRALTTPGARWYSINPSECS